MALTKILPSSLDSTQNYTINTITANTVVSNGVNLFTFANAAFTAANNASDSWVRNQANASFIQANAAFTAANNASDSWVRNQANAAFIQANAAYTKANTAGSGASVSVGSTAPVTAANGSLWYDDTTTGELFVYASNNWISTTILPYTLIGDPGITGVTQSNEATTQTFTIGNYNSGYTYIIAVTGGSVSRTNQYIYWTMPSVTTNTTHYMTTQVITAGVTSLTDTRTVLVVNLNISDTSIVVTDFTTSYANTVYGWVVP
jgi:hypothetical protein